jgi:3-hydroxyisobutyrate dehydrogenase-like beta-hydroxyacid dehydrogenase
MRVGFIGLGSMGLAMADNVRRAGHQLSVFNRTPGKAEDLSGVQVAATPGEAASEAEVVITMLADDAAVESTVFGDGGIFQAMPDDAVHVGMTTMSHALTVRLAQAHADAGQAFVAAPVFGRPDAARAAKLWIVAAGAAPAVDRCRPVFDAMGQGVEYLGDDPGQAAILKIAGNFLLASLIETLGEAYALVRGHGLEPSRFLEIVNGRVFRSPVYENYGKIIAEGRFDPPGFKLRHGLKDTRLALAAGEAAHTPLPIASLLRDHYLEALARGWGELDWSAMAAIAAAAAGLEAPEPPASTPPR